jgi:hypothetical protein
VNAQQLIYEFLDNLLYEFPNLNWETDEHDQIVIWEEEDE